MKFNFRSFFFGSCCAGIFFGLVLFSFATPALSITPVSGEVGGQTWTLTSSPYRVSGEVIVPENSILTIEAGVTVEFEVIRSGVIGTSKISIYGTLLAIGAAGNHITFTSSKETGKAPQDWYGLYLNTNTTDRSLLKYCIIEYAERGVGLYNGSSATVSESILRRSNYNLVCAAGGSPMITNNVFTSSESHNVWVQASSPIIAGNTISFSKGTNGFGILADSNAYPSISGNVISNNASAGIYCLTNSGGLFPLISGNTIESNSGYGGIRLSGSRAVIENNSISGNVHGVYCQNGSYPYVFGNTISGSANYGVYSSASSPRVTFNNITGNTLGGVTSEYGVDATSNWWGSASGPGGAVSSHVAYLPYLDAPVRYSPPSSISSLDLKADKNYASTFSGYVGIPDMMFVEVVGADSSPESYNWTTVVVTNEYATDDTMKTVVVNLMETMEGTGVFRGIAWTCGYTGSFNDVPTDRSRGFINASPGDRIRVSASQDISRSFVVFTSANSYWRAVNSPIRLIGGSAYTPKYRESFLYIDPGVTVEAFYGSMVYLGRSIVDRVIFTSADPSPVKGDWNGIYAETDVGGVGPWITNSTIRYGIKNIDINANYTGSTLVKDCTISDGIDGIRLAGSNSRIIRNNIRNNTYGVNMVSFQPFLRFNNFTGNTFAVYVQNLILLGAYVDASDNYWGSASGPGGEGSGSGDAVTKRVAFVPWITDEITSETAPVVSDIGLFLDKACTVRAADEGGVGVLDNLYIRAVASSPDSGRIDMISAEVERSGSAAGSIVCSLIETTKESGVYVGVVRVNSNLAVGVPSYPTLDGHVGYIGAADGDMITVRPGSASYPEASINVTKRARWRKANNPNRVLWNKTQLVLPAGYTLVVEPGVSIEVSRDVVSSGGTAVALYISGTIEAIGSPESPIMYRPCVPDWFATDGRSFYVNGPASGGSVLRYFDYQGAYGLYLNGGTTAKLEKSVIKNIGITAVNVEGSVTIRECEIAYPTLGSYGWGIIISGGYVPRIEYNYIHDCNYGISVNASGALIRSNTIEANNPSNLENGGGILFGDTPHATLTPEVIDNTIRNNRYNAIRVNRAWNKNMPFIHYNRIYHMTEESFGVRIVPSSSPPTIDATSNYWGGIAGPFHSSNPAGNLKSKVTDYVLFDPYLTEEVSFGGPSATEEFPANGSAVNDRLTRISIKVTDQQGLDLLYERPVISINGVSFTYPAGGRVSYEGQRLIFNTTEAFADGTVEAVLVSAKDIIGNDMIEPFQWMFLVDVSSPEFVGIEVSPSIAGPRTVLATIEVLDALSGMDYGRLPTVELNSSGEKILFRSGSYASGVWTGTVEIVPSSENGPASVEASGFCDMAGNFLLPTVEFNAVFIDTVSPEVLVSKPLTGEVMSWGLTYNISWDAHDPSPSSSMPDRPISIYFSSMEGGQLVLITQETENDGIFEWVVPNIISTRCAVAVDAQDMAGNPGRAFCGLFSIEAINPTVISIKPADGQTLVPVEKNSTYIEVVFSKLMDIASVQNAFSISPEAAGYFTWLSEKLIYNLSADLAHAATYEVSISSEAKDLSGNPLLNAPVRSFFTTVSLDLSPPTITSVYVDDRAYSPPPPVFIMTRSPEIKALITDEVGGSGVDPTSIRIFADGAVFTAEAYKFNELTGWLTYRIPHIFGIGTYVITIEARDRSANIGSFEGEFQVIGGPVIDEARIDDRAYLAGDIISSLPKFQARVLDQAGTTETIDPSSIAIKVGPHVLIPGAPNYSFATGIMNYNMAVEPFALGPGTYNVTIEASDVYGNLGSWTGLDLRVMSGSAKVIGAVLSYPSPFKPMGGQPVIIAYDLSLSADLVVYVYDASGRVALTKKFYSGNAGGKAGYNSFEWSGRTDLGNIAGNGIYVIKVTSGGRVIGTGKLVVLD